MPKPTTRSRLRDLALSSSELKHLTGWPPKMIEDYLNRREDAVLLADLVDVEIDQKLEEIPTDFLDGSIPFAEGGFVDEDNTNLQWDNVLKLLFAKSLQTDFVQYNITADPTTAEGRTSWDEDDHCPAYGTGLGNDVQVGQELWGIGVNKTGGTATDGKVVYANGVQGNRLTYDFADARDGDKSSFVGVVTAPTINNAEGPVTTFGYVRDIDTSAWVPGTKLYIAADGTGDLTSTAPVGPDYVILVANVTNQHLTQGEMFVAPRIDIGNGVTLNSLYIATTLNTATLTVREELITEVSALTNITAAGGITVTDPIMKIQGSGGPIEITANPQIGAGTDGQRMQLYGQSDVNTVTLNTGNGLHLHGQAIMADHDRLTLVYDSDDSEWEEESRNFTESEKAWAFDSPTGTNGVFYFGGYYDFAPSDNDFNPVVSFGTVNSSYAAHFFVVAAAGGAGGVDTVIRVTGTSITDADVRTPGDIQDITLDDAGAAGAYYETPKKWLGQVTIVVVSGPDLLCNYGFAKYWDNNNNDFRISGAEATWLGGANDGAADIEILHHNATGWTYNAGAEPTPPVAIGGMNASHVTEINIVNNENGAWKRSGLSLPIAGGDSEGTIIRVTTSANKAFELGNFLLRVRPA